MSSEGSDRRETLRLLVQLAQTSDPRACWDQERAEQLLRNQSSPSELRELGIDESIIGRIWPKE